MEISLFDLRGKNVGKRKILSCLCSMCTRSVSWLPTAWLCGLLIHLLDRWRPSRPGLRIVDHLGQPPPPHQPHFTYPRFTLSSPPPPHKSLIHSSPAFFFAKCALMCLRRLYQRNRAGGRETSFMWPMQAVIHLLWFPFSRKWPRSQLPLLSPQRQKPGLSESRGFDLI